MHKIDEEWFNRNFAWIPGFENRYAPKRSGMKTNEFQEAVYSFLNRALGSTIKPVKTASSPVFMLVRTPGYYPERHYFADLLKAVLGAETAKTMVEAEQTTRSAVYDVLQIDPNGNVTVVKEPSSNLKGCEDFAILSAGNKPGYTFVVSERVMEATIPKGISIKRW